MQQFNKRISLTKSQRKEVERYLGDMTVMTEYGFLQIVRKLKLMEQKLGDLKYE